MTSWVVVNLAILYVSMPPPLFPTSPLCGETVGELRNKSAYLRSLTVASVSAQLDHKI